MSQTPIDLDTESIQLDGHWYNRDDLARRIKTMLDSGDFAVSKPSQALEQLTMTLASCRTMAFKVTPDMAEAVAQAAARQGRTVSGLIRDAIATFLALPPQPQPAADPKPLRPPSPPGRKTTEPELPAIVAPVSPAPVAGPGALKPAQVPGGAVSSVMVDPGIVTEVPTAEEAASAVSLKPKQKEDEGPVERGWFGR